MSTADEAASRGKPPQHWWQWFLIYPTVLIALITAVPEWLKIVEGWRQDIPAAQLEEAKRQHDLWKRNLECTMRPMELFLSPTNVKVDATVCDSGDVFVRIFTPANEGRFHWVDVNHLVRTAQAAPPGGLLAAFAQERTAVERAREGIRDSFVMCQRFVDDRLLLRVINAEGQCFDETVDTFTGVVSERVEAQCRETC